MPIMGLKKLLYIESDQEINPGMVRVLLEFHGIDAEVAEVKIIRKDDQIVVVREGKSLKGG